MSTFKVSKSISTKTGFSPNCAKGQTEVGQHSDGTNTSSPTLNDFS